ncbi:MAG: hypothetical protein KUG65_06340 [Sphingomonadaceae bacterium]|nr:hypothetical protein [Sphingomonadaceae bacterium]
MTSPSTFQGESGGDSEIDWNDSAELHKRGDGGGLLDSFKSIRRGAFAEMIRFVMSLPEDERGKYVIDKAGDRRFQSNDIEALARRPDFPET